MPVVSRDRCAEQSRSKKAAQRCFHGLGMPTITVSYAGRVPSLIGPHSYYVYSTDRIELPTHLSYILCQSFESASDVTLRLALSHRLTLSLPLSHRLTLPVARLTAALHCSSISQRSARRSASVIGAVSRAGWRAQRLLLVLCCCSGGGSGGDRCSSPPCQSVRPSARPSVRPSVRLPPSGPVRRRRRRRRFCRMCSTGDHFEQPTDRKTRRHGG